MFLQMRFDFKNENHDDFISTEKIWFTCGSGPYNVIEMMDIPSGSEFKCS